MSENLHELCSLLVEEFYGAFHARLFSQLAYYGRLSIPQIAQKSHLPLKHVKAGIATLVQLRLVNHHSTAEGFSTYQANAESAYELVRVGRLVELVKHRIGDLSAIVISEAVVLGFATVGELERNTLNTISGQATSHNGASRRHEEMTFDAHHVRPNIKKLIQDGYLVHLRSAHLQTAFDAKFDVETCLKRTETQIVKGKKDTALFDAAVESEYQNRVSSYAVEQGYVPGVSSGKKRPNDDVHSEPNLKRPKTNGHLIPSSTGQEMDEASLLCVNFDNLVSETRNSYLRTQAQKTLGSTHSEILEGMLLYATKNKRFQPSTDFITLDLSEIRDEVNLRRLNHTTPARQQINGHTKTNGTLSDDDNQSEHDKVTYNEIDRSLTLLADGEFSFLHGEYGKEWKLSKDELDKLVREHEMLRLMGDRLGLPALRIVRMLIDKGKLDEKTLQELGLLSAKELRQTLAELKQMGYVDLQEVPREAQRQPNRTIYLWFHDASRVQRVLLDTIYQAMSRLIQRAATEKRKLSSTLEKMERSDVQGKEDEIMSTAELKVLRRWQRLDQWIFGEIARLDQSVALLRDL